MIDSTALAAISLLSGAIGAVLFVRSKLEEQSKAFAQHVAADEVAHSSAVAAHSSVIDRLARIETKLDALKERRNEP